MTPELKPKEEREKKKKSMLAHAPRVAFLLEKIMAAVTIV